MGDGRRKPRSRIAALAAQVAGPDTPCMREQRTRGGQRATGEQRQGMTGRRLTVLLGVVAALLVGLVAYRYWPAWIGDVVRDLHRPAREAPRPGVA